MAQVKQVGKLLTTKQLCEKMGWSKWTVYEKTSKGTIPFIKQGGLRFDEDEINKWLLKKEHKAG